MPRKRLSPATAPCEASRQKLTGENDDREDVNCDWWCVERAL
jgi:hypothetical protein